MAPDEVRLALRDALSLADSFLALVDNATDRSSGVPTGDRNDVILVNAYARAYRCLRSIRDLAARGEADDAAVLVRALLSVILRSLYIVEPDDHSERQRRLAQYVHKSRREQRMMIEELLALGYEFTDEDLEHARDREAETTWAGDLPPDKNLARALGLSPFYSHVYRPASDATHFGIVTMLGGFEKEPESVSGEGASVSLLKSDPESAAEALVYGILSYGAFLERSDAVIGHGVTAAADVLVRAYFGVT